MMGAVRCKVSVSPHAHEMLLNSVLNLGKTLKLAESALTEAWLFNCQDSLLVHVM